MVKNPLKSNLKNALQQSDWRFWVWLLMLFLVLLIVAVVSTAWAVHTAMLKGPVFTESQSQKILSVATYPQNVNNSFREIAQMFGADPVAILMDRKDVEKPSWVRRFPAPEDHGYLFFSGVDANAKQYVAKLIRIADGTVVARWQPDFITINHQLTDKKWEPKSSWIYLRVLNPILLDDGDILFNTGNSLVRQGSCSTKPVWVLDETAHHSNELDESRNAVWSPSVSQEGFPRNNWLKNHLRDDALGHFSLTGKLLERRSFTNILIDNGLASLLLGTSGVAFNEDPIHMNEIKVATFDSRYWKRGDLLISSRHLSTVFLYRPSTNKILWHQTGPWMNQHSVDFVNNHQISIFSNNVVSGKPSKEYSFLTPDDINRVYVFDFDNNEASEPYKKLLEVARPISLTEGRAQILADGGLFVEETNFGRHLRFTKDALLWSRVNDYDDRRIGNLSWSRYLTPEEASLPLKSLAAKHCESPT